MTTDTEIRILGLKALTDALGNVDAERFITLVLREPFDYTAWQKELWQGRSVGDISKSAMARRARGTSEALPNKTNAADG